MRQVVGQSRLSTSLRVPHKTGTNPLRKFALYRHRGKELLIAHDVLLISRFDLTVHFSLHTHIGNAVAQQIEQAFGAAHRGQNPIGGGEGRTIGLILRTRVDHLAIVVLKNLLLDRGDDIPVGIVLVKRRDFVTSSILFSETIEGSKTSCSRAVERAFHRYHSSPGVVFHIVREDHQLRDVDEATKLRVGKSLFVHARTFSHHAAGIIGLFHLDEAQRQPIDEQSDVRTKLSLSISTGEFCRTMEYVCFRVVKIDQFERRGGFEPLIKTTTQIVIIEFFANRR